VLGSASDSSLGELCCSSTPEVITTPCTKIATAAAVADQAIVRGVRLDSNPEMWRWCDGARAALVPFAMNALGEGGALGKCIGSANTASKEA
jgi:hypothetical protein